MRSTFGVHLSIKEKKTENHNSDGEICPELYTKKLSLRQFPRDPNGPTLDLVVGKE
jgi:hypothetical protein